MRQEEYALSLAQSEQVLQLSKIAIKVKWDALDVLAHSSLRLKDSLKAQNLLNWKTLRKTNWPQRLYFKAYNQYRQKSHEKSNETIALIAKKYSSAGEWCEKFVVDGSQIEQLEDSFNLFILESGEENFKSFQK